MLPRALASLLCLLGAAALGLGVASATVWRADDTLVATVEATTLVATEPGVLDLAADDVTVRAEAEGDVVVALGRTADVEAWIGTDRHTWVTGLVDRRTLSTRDVAAASADPAATPAPGSSVEPTAVPTEGSTEALAPAAVPDPTGSDLWVAEATGTGEAELEWSRQDGRWSVLVAAVGPDAGPVTLELTWPQVVTTPWLVPGVVGGGLLLLAGLLWWVVLLWGTRWLGPVGAVSRAGSARLLALLRHEEVDEVVRRPATHPVPVVEGARPATGEVSRVVPAPSAVALPDVHPAAGGTEASDAPGDGARGRDAATDLVRHDGADAPTATPVPLPHDGAPLTRRQLRERAAAASVATPGTDERAPTEPPTPAEPPTPTRRGGPRLPSWRPGRRHPADVDGAPAAAPEALPETPPPAAVPTAPSASADAWRRAWGIPAVERSEEPASSPLPPGDGPSTDAREGEDR